MGWRAAQSITVLRKQLNNLFPNRSKISDGIVGDLRHKRSKSDHNPNALGVVRAFDITHDPGGGVDCNQLAASLTKFKDPRIKYLIWNKKICSSKKSPWKWRKYNGSNGHTKHLHISVNNHNYDVLTPWLFNEWNESPWADFHPDPEDIEFGDRGFAVTKLQKDLSELGYLKTNQIDGWFGNNTLSAVKTLQAAAGLDTDGIVGPNTHKAIMKAMKKT